MYDNSLVGTGLEAGGFRFELRRHSWSSTRRTVFEQTAPMLGFVVGGQFDGEGRLRSAAPNGFRKLGRLTFTPAAIPFEVRGSAGQALVASFRIAPGLFDRLTHRMAWDEDRLTACCDVRGTAIESALARLAREAACPGFANDVLLEAAGAMIAVDLARYLDRPAAAKKDPARRRFSPAELSRIADLVECDVTASLETIAAHCGVSVRTLTRVFKASTGGTVGDMIADARIRKAMELLRGSALPLKTIAHRVGFASTSGFCTAFHRAAGMAPGVFRAGGSLQ